MSDTETKTEEVQKKYKSDVAQNALNALLEAGGFAADDLQIALEAIKTAKFDREGTYNRRRKRRIGLSIQQTNLPRLT